MSVWRFVAVLVGLAAVLLLLHAANLLVPSPFHKTTLVEPRSSMPIPGDPLRALDARQRTALDRWLAARQEFEVLTHYYCDFEHRRGLCETDLVDRNPYLAVSDFNGDGYSDFAIVLASRSRPLRAFVAVFNGPFAGNATQEPALLAEDQDFMRLGDELHVVTFDGRSRLFLGPPVSDNGYAVVPKGTSYDFEYTGNVG